MKAPLAEKVDAPDLKSVGETRASSSLAGRTILTNFASDTGVQIGENFIHLRPSAVVILRHLYENYNQEISAEILGNLFKPFKNLATLKVQISGINMAFKEWSIPLRITGNKVAFKLTRKLINWK